jgi:hypothetical protein
LKKKKKKKRRTELQIIPFYFSFGLDSRCEETVEEFGDEKGRTKRDRERSALEQLSFYL